MVHQSRVTGSDVGGAQPSKSAFGMSGQCFIPYCINSFLSSDIIFLYQIKYILPVYIYVAIAGKESLWVAEFTVLTMKESPVGIPR